MPKLVPGMALMPSGFEYTTHKGKLPYELKKAAEYHTASTRWTHKKVQKKYKPSYIKYKQDLLDKKDYTWSTKSKYLPRDKFSKGFAKLQRIMSKKNRSRKVKAFNKLRPVYDLT